MDVHHAETPWYGHTTPAPRGEWKGQVRHESVTHDMLYYVVWDYAPGELPAPGWYDAEILVEES
jgi:hypothetical protein